MDKQHFLIKSLIHKDLWLTWIVKTKNTNGINSSLPTSKILTVTVHACLVPVGNGLGSKLVWRKRTSQNVHLVPSMSVWNGFWQKIKLTCEQARKGPNRIKLTCRQATHHAMALPLVASSG